MLLASQPAGVGGPDPGAGQVYVVPEGFTTYPVGSQITYGGLPYRIGLNGTMVLVIKGDAFHHKGGPPSGKSSVNGWVHDSHYGPGGHGPHPPTGGTHPGRRRTRAAVPTIRPARRTRGAATICPARRRPRGASHLPGATYPAASAPTDERWPHPPSADNRWFPPGQHEARRRLPPADERRKTRPLIGSSWSLAVDPARHRRSRADLSGSSAPVRPGPSSASPRREPHLSCRGLASGSAGQAPHREAWVSRVWPTTPGSATSFL